MESTFQILIRRAIQADARFLMLVHRDAVFSKAAGYYDEATLESWSPGATPERVARMERTICDPKKIVLVAEHQGQILGFAVAIPDENEIGALYVKPNNIGNVGRALLFEIEKLVFAAGALFIEFDASLNAESFYKANGYMEVGRADHVSGRGDVSAAVQMKKIRSADRQVEHAISKN
ncbi:MAG: GNAT family N-acetyltransferase [Rhodospirillaceae bacterium]